MKMTRYMNLLSRVAVLALLPVFAACTDEVKVPDDNTGADSNAITFSIFPESAQAGSRAASDETHETHISDGSMINRLYYVIYKEVTENGETKFEIDTHYNTEVKSIDFTKYEPFTLRLIPNPEDDVNTQYKILCWAQWEDENTKKNPYYDISGFPEEIKVSYDGAMNNDEARDAFYASKEFSINDKGTVVKVILERPFAQINVGTSGWDYEGIAYIQPNPQVIKYSKIIIKGAADRLDVLNNRSWYSEKVVDENAEPLEVVFNFDVIPAYRNVASNKELFDKIEGIKTIDDEKIYQNGIKEEFLKINLPRPENPETKEIEDNGDDVFAEYLGWKDYDYFCSTSGGHAQLLYDIYTETFKYMSMSYVLVPFTKSNNVFNGSTVNVNLGCAVELDENGNEKENPYADYKSVVDLKNVPANRNYRTNIIAADGTGFFMNANEINVAIYSETFADYYKRLRSTEKDWDQIDDEDDPDAVGDGINGEYGEDEGLGDEFIPDDLKTPLVLPVLEGLTVKFGGENKTAGNVERRIIDLYRYSDENVIITFDLYKGLDRYSFLTGDNGMFTKDDFEFAYYLGKDETPLNITPQPVSGKEGQYTLTIPMETLISKIGQITPIETPVVDSETWFENYQNNNNWYTRSKFVDDTKKDALFTVTNENLPTLRYYPIEFKVKTILKEPSNKFRGGDLIVTIRLHTAYKFTFSSISSDEGGEVWNDLVANNKIGSKDNNTLYEENSYYIDNGIVASSTVGRISAKSRTGVGDNHRLFAIKDAQMGDHLRFKGAAYFTKDGIFYEGHLITLHNLRENCVISCKMGRDIGQDNNAKNNATPNNRSLFVEWNGAKDNNPNKPEGWDWYGYNPSTTKTDFLKGADTETKRYVFDETKIFSNYTTTIDSFDETKDVELYTLSSGYCVYWVILSEPGNN